MHLSDEELLEGADLDAACNNTTTATAAESVSVSAAFALLENIKTSLCNCAAWLLRTCTVALRQADEVFSGGHLHQRGRSASTAAAAHTVVLMKLLYSSCSAMSFGAERGSSNVSVLEKLLDCATSLPSHPSSASAGGGATAVLNAEIQKCLDATTVAQQIGKAGRGWGDFNQFVRQDAAYAGALSYKAVDLHQLSHLLKQRALQQELQMPPPRRGSSTSGNGYSQSIVQLSMEDVQNTLQAAVFGNYYQKNVAAKAHLCVAWCQLVAITVSTGGRLRPLLMQLCNDGELSSTAPATAGAGASSTTSLVLAYDKIANISSATASATASSPALAQLVFEQLYVPTANVLLSRVLRMQSKSAALPEYFARTLLSLVGVVAAATSGGGGRINGCMLLLPDQHARLLQLAIQLLLQHRDSGLSHLQRNYGGSSDGGTATAASPVFRGLLAAALVQVLNAPHKQAEASAAVGAHYADLSATADGECGGYYEENKFAGGGGADQSLWEVDEEMVAEYEKINVVSGFLHY